ncbi:LOW QUALITY PROTEIN: zinc transporter, ZIP family [Bacillus sp. JCM 19046]|nr:LOW QUALITY PROTEIN: zinc transporter, ZIP family [Bacillus sp. JCM 19046]
MDHLLIGSTLAALATGVGALPILFFKQFSHKWRDVLLAFTAGVMVSASMLELLPESLALSNIYVTAIGLILGTFVLTLLERKVPHIHIEHKTRTIVVDRKAALIVAAITLHNLPEGLAVGVSFASEQESMGPLIALAMGIQNMPEGLLVALYLVQSNIGKWKAFLVATATGAVEIVTALLGFWLASYISFILRGLAFAAGAMLFIVYKELIPESHGDGNERSSTFSFIGGLLVMLLLIDLFS